MCRFVKFQLKVLFKKNLMLYFAVQFINVLKSVIKKGRGIRPVEALATLCPAKKVLNSTKLDR